jgi:WD40-like Beta Propeller Repeat
MNNKLVALISLSILASAVQAQTATDPATRPAAHPDIIVAGTKPAVFLQEGVSVPNQESAPAFTADGNAVFFADSNFISFSKKVNGKWTHPARIKFADTASHYRDWDPALTMGGKRLIFSSNRPWKVKSNHLWYADRLDGDTWSQPKHMDAPVNWDGAPTYAPSISAKGTICFCSRDRDGNKGMRGYCSLYKEGQYEKPIMLRLNGDEEIFDPFISPDEHYIIFASTKKLFISYREGNDWSAGQALGPQVNGGGWNGGPYVSPDGKMLYYSSSLTDGLMMIPVHIQ